MLPKVFRRIFEVKEEIDDNRSVPFRPSKVNLIRSRLYQTCLEKGGQNKILFSYSSLLLGGLRLYHPRVKGFFKYPLYNRSLIAAFRELPAKPSAPSVDKLAERKEWISNLNHEISNSTHSRTILKINEERENISNCIHNCIYPN